MTWVIWRQYRGTAAIAGAILAAFAVLLLITGLQDIARWHAALATCAKDGTCSSLSQTLSLGGGPLGALTGLTLAVPLLFGMFWAAPAVARERETGTVQFAWTQSVTRWRWLSAKTSWLLLAGVTQNFTPKGAFWPLSEGTVLPGGRLLPEVGGFIPIPASCHPAEGQIRAALACTARLGYRSFTTYQPGYRFWPFQFIETGIFVALAAALIAVTFVVVRRRDA